MNKKTRNLGYYLFALGFFVLLKIYFKYATNSDLAFLLYPTNELVTILTGSTADFIEKIGFYNEQLDFIIDKSCAGFNFFGLTFLMLSFLGISKIQNLPKMLIFPIAFLLSFVFTILANTSRIIIALRFEPILNNIFENQSVNHQVIGVITYLTYLIIIYLTVEFVVTKKINNAKYFKS